MPDGFQTQNIRRSSRYDTSRARKFWEQRCTSLHLIREGDSASETRKCKGVLLMPYPKTQKTRTQGVPLRGPLTSKLPSHVGFLQAMPTLLKQRAVCNHGAEQVHFADATACNNTTLKLRPSSSHFMCSCCHGNQALPAEDRALKHVNGAESLNVRTSSEDTPNKEG